MTTIFEIARILYGATRERRALPKYTRTQHSWSARIASAQHATPAAFRILTVDMDRPHARPSLCREKSKRARAKWVVLFLPAGLAGVDRSWLFFFTRRFFHRITSSVVSPTVSRYLNLRPSDSYNGSNMLVDGGEFTCQSTKNGGFLFASDGSRVNITGGLIVNNTAARRGAAVSVSWEDSTA